MSAVAVDLFRLSAQQRRLWSRAGAAPACRAQGTLLLEEAVDAERLTAALRRLAAAHESLRTSFETLPGRKLPGQRPWADAEIHLQRIDLRALGAGEQEREARAVARRERQEALDLERPPVLRGKLLALAPRRHLLVLTLPALCADFRSLENLAHELAWRYAAGGREASDPPVIQYADFADWQARWLDSEESQAGRAHWRRHDAPASEPPLPYERAEPTAGGGIDVVALEAGAATRDRIEALSRERDVSAQALLLACWGALLWRLSDGAERPLWVAFEGRGYAELDDALGLFERLLPVRCDRRPDEGLIALARRLNEAAEEAALWQEYFAAEGETSAQEPTVAAAFEHRLLAEAPATAGPLRIALRHAFVCTEPFRLKLSCQQDRDRLELEIHYARHGFARHDMERLLAAYGTLLRGALASPTAPLAELEVVGEADRASLLGPRYRTVGATPLDCCVHELFERQAARTPDAVAVRCHDGDLSYRDLDQHANRLAQWLRRHGIRPEARIAVLLERSRELPVALLGVHKAGAAYVALPADAPAARLEQTLADSGARLLITRRELLPCLAGWSHQVLCLDRDLGSPPARESTALSAPAPGNLAYVAYTSGSTGRPKGVMATHRGVVNYLAYVIDAYALNAGDRVLQIASPAFDASVRELFAPLAVGGTVVLPSAAASKDPAALVALMREWEVTALLSVVPTLLRRLLAVAREQGGACPALRLVLVSGEILYGTDAADVRSTLGDGVLVVNQYGPTECTMTSSYHRLPAAALPGPAAVGKPIPNACFHVVDSSLRLLPIGIPSEVLIGGAGLARGYLGRPDLTAERFVPDPFGEPGGRLYRTGDRGRWNADRDLEFLGRVDRQLKVRGFRIEPGEIEAVLAEHPAVRQAVVVLRQDGPGEPHLVAYVTPAGPQELARALRAHLGERLPDYMVPAAVVFLNLLPVTTTGKVDLAALPPPGLAAAGRLATPARTPSEEVLAGIWSDILGHDEIGVEEDFFELGGHSLLAAQLVARIADTLGVEVPLRMVFDAPTVAGLAGAVDSARRGTRGEALPAVARDLAGTAAPLPLSFGQERLWFLDRLEPGQAAYNMPTALRLQGRLEQRALGRALTAVVRRHEVLRTNFRAIDGRPVQVIAPAGAVAPPLVDLAALAGEPRAAELERLVQAEAGRPFDLEREALFRCLLVRSGKYEHLLFANLHHIVFDGWSTGILVAELAELYAAFAAGRDPLLPELPIQYHDFAAWQRCWLTDEALAPQLAYWQERLRDLPPRLELPLDRPRPLRKRYLGARRSLALAPGLGAALRRLERGEGATLFMVLLAAFQTLLSRYSGQRDVSVGTAVSGRHRLQTERLIGFFVDTLVMRGDLGGDPSFRELLRRVRRSALEAYDNQDVPFERLVEELQPERSLQTTPLFQAMLVLHNLPRVDLDLAGLSLSGYAVRRATAKFDLELLVSQGPSGLVATLEYDRDLFLETTALRLLRHLATLLEAVAEDADRPLSALPLLTAGERHQVLHEWGDTAATLDEHLLPRLFADVAIARPDALAVATDGGSGASYAEFARRADDIAAALDRNGVATEGVVAVLADRGPALLAAMLGIWKAGAAYLPLDPSHPPARHRQVLERARPQALLAGDAYRSRLAEVVADLSPAERPPLLALAAPPPAADPSGVPRAPQRPDHLAYVFFTSGSTGSPKGAMVTHQGMLNHLRAKMEQLRLGPADVVAQTASQCFDISIWQFLAPLLVGGRVLVLADDEVRDPLRLLAELRRGGATVLEVVPSLLRVLLDDVPAAEAERTLARLRWVICTGEALAPELCRAWHARFPAVPLLNAYGPTECSDDVTHALLAPPPPAVARVPIGRAIRNTRLYVLDDALRPLPLGVAGELYVAGAGVGRGYLNDAARTAESFLPDPHAPAPGGRLYRTGDQARLLPDGQLDFLGRVDQQVKLRGMRIELGEIESALARHPAVADAAVLAREDEPAGPSLVAYVVGEVAAAELRCHLQQHLPEAMIPTAFVSLPRLPLTANGKLDRRALPSPAPAAGADGRRYALTPGEEMLAALWSEVLGRDGIGAHDSFFDLGGHSLLATQVVSRIRQLFGIEVPLRRLFEAPTLGELAQEVERARRTTSLPAPPPLVPTRRDGELPLSFAQQRLWFLDQLQPDGTTFNIASPARLRGPLSLSALERTFNEILRRHEVLRTTFREIDGRPFQVVAPPRFTALPRVDLRAVPDNRCEAEVLRLASREAETPFDLARGPLLRVTLLHLAPEDHVVLLAMHHIASDAWSVNVLLQEVSALYAAFAAGRPSPLPELPVQYPDFALWQRSWLQGAVLEAQLAHWTARLAGAPPRLEITADRPREAAGGARGARRRLVLPEPLPQALRGLARRERVTLFMVVLAAFQTLLHWDSGQDDVVVGTDVANRNRLETEGLIGFFINQLTLRTDLAGDPTFAELLGRVREVTLDAYAHQDLPFEALVEALNPDRSLRSAPFFQIKVNLLNLPPVEPALGALMLTPLEVHGSSAKLDLILDVLETPAELKVLCEYDTELFDGATIDRLLGRFQALLAAAAASPASRLSELQQALAELEQAEEARRREIFREARRRMLDQAAPRPVATSIERSL
jgi:amino acid adenylation domain-containing protein